MVSMFYTYEDVIRLTKIFSDIPSDVSDELRGWNWNQYPLLPPSRTQVSVSEVLGGFCDSQRFVYVKRVLKEKQTYVPKLSEGILIHRVFGEALASAKSLILQLNNNSSDFRYKFMRELALKKHVISNGIRLENRKIERISRLLWEFAADVYSATYNKVIFSSYYLSADGIVGKVIPMISEFPLDGTYLGFSSNIRADAFIPPNILIEIKTRTYKHQHKLQLAAYAMVLESLYRIPINHSIILYAYFDGKQFHFNEKIVAISDNLRSEVIEKRDLALKVIDEHYDPGFPDKCDRYCPYLEVCGVGEDSIS
ncbi:MAG: type I-A CRISPR-associated protein Cas4/Csa1 [Candidatus Nitrosocaldaceae archaeon]|nr:MAG: type I-A CRISPR-associated protein Cas4/Csa1 [Candidatus Nitrosocaldaceae archaeon]